VSGFAAVEVTAFAGILGDMLRIGAVVIHVNDARRASEFWSQALGFAYSGGGYSADRTPVLVPAGAGPGAGAGTGADPAADPAGAVAVGLDESDGTHLDLYTDSAAEQRAEVERLISLGASPVDWTYPEDARWVVLADPEGNHFCVINTGRD
jgi:catechol 2,3-dioxygenase-like lactoylglutathione lyase family enzyme